MLNPSQIAVVLFVSQTGADVPAKIRIKLYRGLADFMGSDKDEKAVYDILSKMAGVLEDAEAHCAQLELQLKLPK